MTENHPILPKDADPEAIHALKIGVGFLHKPDTDLIICEGADVVKLVQGLVLNNVFLLADPGSGQLTASVNNVGRLISVFRLMHLKEMLILDAPEDAVKSGLLLHLRTHVITEDARFKDRSSGIEKFVVAGPKSLDLLTKLCGGILRQRLTTPFSCIATTLDTSDGAVEAIVQRLDDFGTIDSFQIIVSKEDAVGVDATLESLCVRVGQEVYDFVRLESLGRARWGLELTDQIIPLEGDLNPIVSYDKGCYLGQEIIARLDSRNRYAKRLCTILLKGDVVPDAGVGVSIFDEKKGKEVVVGEVIYAIYSEMWEGVLLRAYLKRPAHELGVDVVVGGMAGRVIEVAGEKLEQELAQEG